MEPKQGRYSSEVLGLELQLEGGRLRFWAGNALLLAPGEMNERLRVLLDGEQRRADEEARQRAEEARRREEAERRREEAERRLAELQAELERLKSRGD
jgi:uncharacterized protein YceH (UPF0502 family)